MVHIHLVIPQLLHDSAKSHKDLGILFDNHLQHASSIASKDNRIYVLNLIKISFEFFDSDVTKTI